MRKIALNQRNDQQYKWTKRTKIGQITVEKRRFQRWKSFLCAETVKSTRSKIIRRKDSWFLYKSVRYGPKQMFLGCLITTVSEAFSQSKERCTRHNMLKFSEELFQSWKRHCNGSRIFQQDLFLCHTSKMVKNFMAKNITILDWPGNPPDVYPIENFGPYAKVDFVLWTMDNYGKTHSSADSRMAQGSDNYKWLFKTSSQTALECCSKIKVIFFTNVPARQGL